MPHYWSSSLELVMQVPHLECLANYSSFFWDKCSLINLKWHWCLLFKMWEQQQHAEACLQVIMAISRDKSKAIYLNINLPMLLITLNHLITAFGWGRLLISSLQNLLVFILTWHFWNTLVCIDMTLNHLSYVLLFCVAILKCVSFCFLCPSLINKNMQLLGDTGDN